MFGSKKQEENVILSEQVKEVLDSWNNNASKLQKKDKAWIQAVRYLITSTDFFIKKIETVLNSGNDKKTAVLVALAVVYDAIVPTLLPTWLKPFSSKIKWFVVNVIISILIDFIVSKYKSSGWGNSGNDNVSFKLI